MNFVSLLIFALAALCCLRADELLPRYSFEIVCEVKANGEFDRLGEGGPVVKLRFTRDPGKGGDKLTIEVRPSEEQQPFSGEELAMLGRAFEAGMRGEGFGKIVRRGDGSRFLVSFFDVEKVPGGFVVQVQRDGELLRWSPEQFRRMQANVAEAKIGKAWWEKLAKAENLPVESPDARPVNAERIALRSEVGALEVMNLRWSFRVEESRGFAKGEELRVVEECRVKGSLGFYPHNNKWLENELKKAAVAQRNREKFSYHVPAGSFKGTSIRVAEGGGLVIWDLVFEMMSGKHRTEAEIKFRGKDLGRLEQLEGETDRQLVQWRELLPVLFRTKAEK